MANDPGWGNRNSGGPPDLDEVLRQFSRKLNSLFGDRYYIFPQVHLSSFIDHKVKNGQYWKAALSHINQKSVDFVLCDKQWRRPLLAIELDDRTHNRPDRVERDVIVEQILSQANMPLLRIARSNSVSTEDLRTLVNTKISTSA